jgi:hypothetical protein
VGTGPAGGKYYLDFETNQNAKVGGGGGSSYGYGGLGLNECDENEQDMIADVSPPLDTISNELMIPFMGSGGGHGVADGQPDSKGILFVPLFLEYFGLLQVEGCGYIISS